MRKNLRVLIAFISFLVGMNFVGVLPAQAGDLTASITSVGDKGFQRSGWIDLDVTFTGSQASGGIHCLDFVRAHISQMKFRYTEGGRANEIGLAGMYVSDLGIHQDNIECRIWGYQNGLDVTINEKVSPTLVELLWDGKSLSSASFSLFPWSIAPDSVSILSPVGVPTSNGVFKLTLNEPDKLFQLVETAVCVDKIGQVECQNWGMVQNAHDQVDGCGDWTSEVLDFGSAHSVGNFAGAVAENASTLKVVIPTAGNYRISVIRHYRMPYERYSDQQACFSSKESLVVDSMGLGVVSPTNSEWLTARGAVDVGDANAYCEAIIGDEDPYPGDEVECTVTLNTAPRVIGTVAVKIYSYDSIVGPKTSSSLIATSSIAVGVPTSLRFTVPKSFTAFGLFGSYLNLGITLDGGSRVPSALTSVKVNQMPRAEILGNGVVGTVLSCDWEFKGEYFYNTYQWLRDGVAIKGATKETYLVTNSDFGRKLYVRIQQNNPLSFTTHSYSSGVTVGYAKLFASTPKILGNTKVGQTLSVSSGKWTAGTRLTYTWLRNGLPILGANKATYKLTKADANQYIAIVIKGSKSGYSSQTKTSAKTRIRK